jgi:hypothetical protein
MRIVRDSYTDLAASVAFTGNISLLHICWRQFRRRNHLAANQSRPIRGDDDDDANRHDEYENSPGEFKYPVPF